MKKIDKILFQYTVEEDLANALTHAGGIIFGLWAIYSLTDLALEKGNHWHFWSYLSFSVSLTVVYIASTFYHFVREEKLKRALRTIDYISIYMLIAGTYTPFLALNVRGNFGMSFLVVVWSMAVLGMIFQLFFAAKYNILSTLTYLAMGWAVIVGFKPIFDAIPREGVFWIIVGGVFYNVGVAFYLAEKIPYNHAIWHIFVILGSVGHYIAIKSSFVTF